MLDFVKKMIDNWLAPLPPAPLVPVTQKPQSCEILCKKKTTSQAILEFINNRGVGAQFTANELRRYVNVYATPAPGSTDRILRDLRNRAVIGYVLVNRQKSLYEITPPKVSVPDATGDSQEETNYEQYATDSVDEFGVDTWADDGGYWYDDEGYDDF